MNGDTFRPFGGDAIAMLGAEESGHATHDDCFADEVVIDFPSVAPAVEKMRHAFTETDRGTPLTARVDLSPSEASEGVTLPLDVPVRMTCRVCGGRGETWSERCEACDGTGAALLLHQVHISVPAGVADGTRYRFSVATRHDPPTRIELHVSINSE
jgi:DnaJ-class molecular chaperone